MNAAELPATRSLLEVLATIPDPRRVNRHHPLVAILALATFATLCGARSLLAIAEWGRHQRKEVARLLGFKGDKTPCVATFHNVFKVLDLDAFEASLTGWARTLGAGAPGDVGALDGKTLRGTTGVEVPGVHLLALLSHRLGIVIAQQPVGAKANELTGARELFQHLEVAGMTITGDAIFTQRDVCETLVTEKKLTISSKSKTTSRRSVRRSLRSSTIQRGQS
jgi:hypothetical protein